MLPGGAVPDPLFPEIDKYVHLILYVFLTLLMIRALRKQFPHGRNDTMMEITAFCAAVAYGIIIEILQETVVTTRSFEVEDILADAMGASLGMVCWYLFVESDGPMHQKN